MCEDGRFRELTKAHVTWGLTILLGLSLLAVVEGVYWTIVDDITHRIGYMTINEAANSGNGLGGIFVMIGVLQLIAFSTAFFGFISGWVHCVIEQKIEEKRAISEQSEMPS